MAQTEKWDYRFGSVKVTGGEKIYSSPNPKMFPEDAHLTKDQLYKITFADIVKLNDINYRGGIKATQLSGGGVQVKVHLYDPTQSDGKGPIIFGCSSGIYEDANASGYNAPDNINMSINDISQVGPVALRPPDKPGNWRSDMKALFISWAKQYSQNDETSHSYKPFNNLKNAFCNVVVEFKITNATLNFIRIPGLRTFAPFDLVFRPNKKVTDVGEVFKNPTTYPNWLFVMDIADISGMFLKIHRKPCDW